MSVDSCELLDLSENVFLWAPPLASISPTSVCHWKITLLFLPSTVPPALPCPVLLQLQLLLVKLSKAPSTFQTSAIVSCSLIIIICFFVIDESFRDCFFLVNLNIRSLMQVEGMMTGWIAASPGGTPAAPRRAEQVRSSFVPAEKAKKLARLCLRLESCSAPRPLIPDSRCLTPWNSRCREGVVAEEPRAVAAQQDRPRRRRGHRHAGLQVSPVATSRSPSIRELDHPSIPSGSVMSSSSCVVTREGRIFAATWNVGGRAPPASLSLDDWLRSSPPADIYVLGYPELRCLLLVLSCVV